MKYEGTNNALAAIWGEVNARNEGREFPQTSAVVAVNIALAAIEEAVRRGIIQPGPNWEDKP